MQCHGGTFHLSVADNSRPAAASYPHLPYSSHQDGKPTGSADKSSIETDKPAFLGSGYLALYESTGERRYLEAAQKIATTLVGKQRPDGSWPFRVIPEDGSIFEDLGGAPVFFVEFFEQLARHDNRPEYRRARDGALRVLVSRHVEQGVWGTYYVAALPADVTMKLSFIPRARQVGRRALALAKGAADRTESGWSFDAKTRVLTLWHQAGEVSVTR